MLWASFSAERTVFIERNDAGCECGSNHYICSVWKLPSAETITCVTPNDFRALEALVLSSESYFDAF